MPRFKFGDRVQLFGDIARFYPCIVGVIICDGNSPAAVLNQYKVRLADGTENVFFDFQLQSPPVTTGRLIVDTISPKSPAPTGGQPPDRQVQLVGRDVDILL